MDFYIMAILLGLAFVPMALGIFLSAKIFNIPDITTDGSFTLGATLFAVMATQHVNPYWATLLILPAGALAGSITGIIHTQLKVNALLSGILVMTALYSCNLLIMQKSNIPLVNASSIFTSVNKPHFIFYNLLLILAIALLIVLCVSALLKTDWGLTMRATGSNEDMVEAQGINPNYIKTAGLAISNALVALSGCLVTQLQGFADINMGVGIVIAGLASVMMADSLTTKNIKKCRIDSCITRYGCYAFVSFVYCFYTGSGYKSGLC